MPGPFRVSENFPVSPDEFSLRQDGIDPINAEAFNSLADSLTSLQQFIIAGGAGSSSIIDVNTSSAALRITQRGSGDVLVVEDEASDTSPFTIKTDGKVGIGTSSPGSILTINTSDPFAIATINSTNTSTSYTHWRATVGTSVGRLIVTGPSFGDSAYGANNVILQNESSGDIRFLLGPFTVAMTNTQRVGIGTANPSATLSVGSSSQFQINSTGNITRINNIATSFPSSQGAANTVLTNDGAGNLSWSAPTGGGGSSDWIVKITTYTAAAGDKILADTTSTSFTITLPSAPTTGQSVQIMDAAGTWGTNILVVARNGLKINGLAEDFVANISGTALEFVYYNSTQGWRVRA